MRRPIGFTAVETDAFHVALARPHAVSVVARVETVNHVFRGECEVLAGQVDGRTTEAPERVCGLTVLDPDGLFEDPSMDLQVQIVYRVTVSGLRTESVATNPVLIPQVIPFTVGSDLVELDSLVVAEVPVFTGVVVRPPTRNGDEVTLETQDRSAIAMRGRPNKTYPGRRNTVTTLRQVLTDCGESRFDRFPKATDIAEKTEDEVNVGEDDELRALVQAVALADSLDRHLFYDTEGYPRLEKYPGDASVIDLSDLVTGQGPVEPPSEIINRVKVIGKRPRDHTVVRTLADVEAGHPLSPQSLKVNGVPQNFTYTEGNDKLDTKAKVTERANRLIVRYAKALRETRTYNLAPIPTLDLFDRVQLGTETVTVNSFSFPLTASGDMTIGYRVPL